MARARKTKKRLQRGRKSARKKKSTSPSHHFSFPWFSFRLEKMIAAAASRLAASRLAASQRKLASSAAALASSSPSAPGNVESRRAAANFFFNGAGETGDASHSVASSSCRRPFSSSSPSSLASSHLEDEDSTFDVAIVGAGMVGLALAGELGEFFFFFFCCVPSSKRILFFNLCSPLLSSPPQF